MGPYPMIDRRGERLKILAGLTVFVPLILFWESFAIPYYLKMTDNSWWNFPFIMTNIILIFVTSLGSVFANYYAWERKGIYDKQD